MLSKFHRKFFYLPKYAKMTDRGVRTRLCLSGLTALLLCAIFASSTFAWFRDQQQLRIVSIHAAEYQYEKTENADGTTTLTATGTTSTGYLKIDAGDKVYYTEQLPPGSSITLTIHGDVHITPVWGERTDNEEKLKDGDTINGSYTATDPTEETQPTEGNDQNVSDDEQTGSDEGFFFPPDETPPTTGPTAPETTVPETTATEPPTTTAPTTESSTPEPSTESGGWETTYVGEY